MDSGKYGIRLKSANLEVEVYGDKEFVLKEFARLLNDFKTNPLISDHIPHSFKEKDPIIGSQNNFNVSVKEFVNSKNPDSALELVAVLAYYNAKHSENGSISEESLDTLWTASGRKHTKRPWQAAIDAKNKKAWLEEIEKGHLKISIHGIHFVENELPSKKANSSK